MKKGGAKARKFITNTLVHIGLAVMAFIWLLPIFWVIITSLRDEKGAYFKTFIPSKWTFNNYIKLWTDTSNLDFPQMFMNTFIIAIFVCIISSFSVLAVAYTMSRLRFKLRKTFMNIAMIIGLFPGFMSMVATYYILKALELSSGDLIKVGLILVYSGGSGLGFYIAKGFFDTIPKALDEAATIDGATKFQVFTRITIPLSKPIIVYTVLTSFISPWTDFVFAKVICRAEMDQYTVAIGMWKMLEKEYLVNWYTPFCAAAVCISIPIAILFVIMQRYYVEGMAGAVKG